MKVIKRDGHTVTYDRSKIITAIKKANAEVEPGEKVTDEKIEEIVQGIESKNRPRMLVEDIQDIIEQKLMADASLYLPRLTLFIVIPASLSVRQIQRTILF